MKRYGRTIALFAAAALIALSVVGVAYGTSKVAPVSPCGGAGSGVTAGAGAECSQGAADCDAQDAGAQCPNAAAASSGEAAQGAGCVGGSGASGATAGSLIAGAQT